MGGSILALNSLFILVLVLVSYKVLRDAIREGLLSCGARTRNAARLLWRKSKVVRRTVRSAVSTANISMRSLPNTRAAQSFAGALKNLQMSVRGGIRRSLGADIAARNRKTATRQDEARDA